MPKTRNEEESRILVGKKLSKSESCESETSALEGRLSASDLATSTDDQSSVTGGDLSMNTSGDSLELSGGESSNSGESCTDNTLTSISGANFSKEVANKLNDGAMKQNRMSSTKKDDGEDEQNYTHHTYSTLHHHSSTLAPHRELQQRGREVQSSDIMSSTATVDFNRIVENFSTDSLVASKSSRLTDSDFFLSFHSLNRIELDGTDVQIVAGNAKLAYASNLAFQVHMSWWNVNSSVLLSTKNSHFEPKFWHEKLLLEILFVHQIE